jgi:putative transposase
MASSPDQFQLLRLFQKVAPGSLFEQLCQEHGYEFRQGIYSVAVVVWLMIWQRLQDNRSLAAAVQCLIQGGCGDLVPDCKRWTDDEVSAATGGYCQARQKLPKLIAKRVSERIVEQLGSEMQEGWGGLARPVFVVDGSSLQLPHEPALVEAFPPGHNQHGENHWPVLRIVVFHDVFSGLALEPAWGPMYGDSPVSEQALAQEALERLPGEAVVLGDGNFGIFALAHAVQQSKRGMVLRLTLERAQKILAGKLVKDTDQPLVWRPSRWERKAHPHLPEQAMVEGRVLVYENPARPGELLCLFTTLAVAVEEILAIYRLRWNVETDLRSLKRTVGLHQLSSKSPDMVEKELLLAMAAYNLIGAVMCLAARRANLKPRQLSFSFVQNVVEAALPGLEQAASEAAYQQRLDRMLRYAAQGKHPNRPQRRSYPREVWGRGSHFPPRKRFVEKREPTK